MILYHHSFSACSCEKEKKDGDRKQKMRVCIENQTKLRKMSIKLNKYSSNIKIIRFIKVCQYFGPCEQLL